MKYLFIVLLAGSINFANASQELACKWAYSLSYYCNSHSPCAPSQHTEGLLPAVPLDEAGSATISGQTGEEIRGGFSFNALYRAKVFSAGVTEIASQHVALATAANATNVTATFGLANTSFKREEVTLRCELARLPVQCPIYDCAPPPRGCGYDFSKAPQTPEGCRVGCGPLICNPNGGGND